MYENWKVCELRKSKNWYVDRCRTWMQNAAYRDVVHPKRRFDPVGESDLASEDVDCVGVSHHGVLLKATREVALRLQLLPLALT